MVRNCRFHLSRGGCNNGNQCRFRHQNQVPEYLSTAAFFSAATTTIRPIRQEHPSTSSSDFANLECWPSLKETIRPIKRDHPATTSNGTPSPEILREDVDVHIENVDVSEASATNETIPPIRQEHPATTSSVTPSQEGLITEELPSVPAKPTQDSSKEVASSANIDGSPLDDGLKVAVTSSSYSADKYSSKEDADAHIDYVDASATDGKIRPINQDHPAREDFDAQDDGILPNDEAPAREVYGAWYPQDDRILLDEAASREYFDAMEQKALRS